MPSSLMSSLCIRQEAKKKGSVSFAPSVDQVETMCLDDFAYSEIEATWYTEKEMDKIARRCLRILNKFEKARSLNETKYCIRGLETHTRVGSEIKQNSRATSIRVVLQEQQRQLDAREPLDHSLIGKVYRQSTSSSQMWAQIVGGHDQREVEGYLLAAGGG